MRGSKKLAEVADRRDLIADLHLKGCSMAAIARRLGVSRRTVERDLDAIRNAWREARRDAVQEAVDRELARLDLLEREAWEGWQRSQQQGVSEKLSKAEDEKHARGLAASGVLDGGAVSGAAKKRAERTTRTQHGDPRYLLLIMKCIERRARLLAGAKPSDAPPVSFDLVHAVLDEINGDPNFLAFARARVAAEAEAAYPADELPDRYRLPAAPSATRP
jgi:lambda repressor-like predicted transcriptional regulator